MATTYKTPGVYVEEISVFPPSVAQVETAIPAFIGYTEKAKEVVDNDLLNVPKGLLHYSSTSNILVVPHRKRILPLN